jgi:multidrug resistance protein
MAKNAPALSGSSAEPGPQGVEVVGCSTAQPIPYTVFTASQKRLLTALIGLAMLFSPMSANIYFPCLPALQRDLRTSTQLVNLTVTSYVIFQGLAPAFFGDLADTIGRRPVFLITFTLYVFSNIGLALQTNYAALLILRIFQSLGCSATVAIGYGIVADIATPDERGKILGLAMVATNLGPSLGPLIGGLLAQKAGWRWVFWFLVIFGGCYLLILLMVLPETGRSIVGNGSLEPRGWNRTILSYLRAFFSKNWQTIQRSADLPSLKMIGFPNPLRSVRILFYRDTALVLYVSAIYYTAYYCVQASMPNIFSRFYAFNSLQIGLSYLSIGAGVVIGGFGNGKLMDRNYAMTAKDTGYTIDKIAGDDMRSFPIERARSRTAQIFVGLCTSFLISYGWLVEKNLHVSSVFIFQFLLGFITTCIVQTFNTLLVDVFPKNPSTAAASGNITRCTLSAIGVAIMQPLFDCIGHGWFFTLVGIVSGLSSSLAISTIQQKGMKWRSKREGNGELQKCGSRQHLDDHMRLKGIPETDEITSQLKVVDHLPEDQSMSGQEVC